MKNGKTVKNIIITVIILLLAGLVFYLARAIMSFAGDPEQFRVWVDEKGILGVLTLMALAAVQAIAVLPAGPVQVAGGYAYGAVLGTIYFLIGCSAGSMLVFMLVRRFGRRLVLVFFSEEKIKHIEEIFNRPKWKRVFVIIFIIPGAPKDMITYCAGMTDISPWIWLLVCSAGRLPGILLSTLGGSAILNTNYTAAAIFFGIAALTSIAGFFVYRKKMK